jgi:hypothetical protein
MIDAGDMFEVQYTGERTSLRVEGQDRWCQVVAGTGCWHMTAVKSGRVLLTVYMKIKLKSGRSQRLSRYLVGLSPDDVRKAIMLCEDGRCCNPEHIVIGTNSEVPRSCRVTRDGVKHDSPHRRARFVRLVAAHGA